MALSSHLQELRKKHQMLASEVEEAQKSPSIPDIQVRELKKRKLKLKEEITRLESA